MSCGCSERLGTLLMITTQLKQKIEQYSIKNSWRVVVKHRLKLNKGILQISHVKGSHCRSRIACRFTGSHILSLFVQLPNIYSFHPQSPKWHMAYMLLFEKNLNFVLRILCHPIEISWKILPCFKIMVENHCFRKHKL